MAALLASPDGRRSASPTAGIIDTDIEYRRPLSRRNSFLNLQYSSWNSLRNLAISRVKSKDGASMSKSTGGNRGVLRVVGESLSGLKWRLCHSGARCKTNQKQFR